MKKTLLMFTVLCLALTATACTGPSNQAYYEEAQLYLGADEYETAASLFSQLGEYEDAAEYALYCEALQALLEDDWDLARTNFQSVQPFKSSSRYLRLLDAMEAEASGNLDAALVIYRELGTFADCNEDVIRLEKAIPEAAMQEGRRLMSSGKYEEARELFLSLDGYGQSASYAENCTAALNRAAYTKADALCDEGDHLAAMQAFLLLGDVLDAPDRAAQCRASLVDALDAAAEAVTLDTASVLIEAYTAIGDEAALARAAELTAKFGANLQLLDAMDEQPYVMLGSYPTGESGVESDLLWRAIKAEGSTVTLLCTTVIDASPIATTTDLVLPDDTVSPTLPAMADLADLLDLSCTATPYAIAQGVPQENGQALYWLRDSLESGLHPVVTGDGTLTIPSMDLTPGIRPMITLSLEEYAFTAGQGTQEDPFR